MDVRFRKFFVLEGVPLYVPKRFMELVAATKLIPQHYKFIRQIPGEPEVVFRFFGFTPENLGKRIIATLKIQARLKKEKAHYTVNIILTPGAKKSNPPMVVSKHSNVARYLNVGQDLRIHAPKYNTYWVKWRVNPAK